MRYANEDGFYELNPFPGCNQLAVSNHAFIGKEHRGQGQGKTQHDERLAKAEQMGYDALICTVRFENVAEKKILINAGWTRVFQFTNRETGSLIETWMKGLGDNEFRYPVSQQV